MPLPIVTIIGRPNVGKSTLFNRVVGQRLAVVEPTPGVTRDRNAAPAEWNDRQFLLIDTGGLVPQSDEEMQRQISVQAELAIETADMVIFLVDGRTGVSPDDHVIAAHLRKTDKPLLIAVNKLDSIELENNRYEFAELGLGEPRAVSATSGLGIGDLLDDLIANLPVIESKESESGEIRLAVVGRPNVGKSSLVNQLLGEQRQIVSPEPGTTRDATDSILIHNGIRYRLVDTAGLRKSAKVKDQIEYYTVLRTLRAIRSSEVVAMLLDATRELSHQDMSIAADIIETGRAIVFVVNKWDLIEKDTHTAGRYVRDLQNRAKPFAFAPVVFVSALTGQRAGKVLELAAEAATERQKHISTAELTDSVLADVREHPPPAVKGRYIQIKFVTQAEKPPPSFVFFCNHPELIRDPYKRYLTNRLRARYGFTGSPIFIRFRKK